MKTIKIKQMRIPFIHTKFELQNEYKHFGLGLLLAIWFLVFGFWHTTPINRN
jgi:hypothetical protein